MMVTLSLTPYLEAFVQQAVASGRFQSVEQLVTAAVRLLEEREHHCTAHVNTLRQQLRKG
jgi:putative addiction module CopG family antidote